MESMMGPEVDAPDRRSVAVDAGGSPRAHGPALRRGAAAFVQQFNRKPRWITAAPGRVNLIGEHTDYSGGFVLPFAIDRHCYVVAAPGELEGMSRIFAADAGTSDADTPAGELWLVDIRKNLYPLAGGKPPSGFTRGGWKSYVAGAIDRTRELTTKAGGQPLTNVDMVIASDVPLGGGLSSSAALEVALAMWVQAATQVELAPWDIIGACREAERSFAGVPCGVMDQAAAVLAQPGAAMMMRCREPYKPTYVPMPREDEMAVLVVNSQVKHALAAGEYGARVEACKQLETMLGALYLSDVDLASVENRRAEMTEEQFNIATHVMEENTRVHAAADAMRRGDWRGLGHLVTRSHESLRDLYRVSCAELDAIVATAITHEGVFGSRMVGGGFGGCAIVLCKPDVVASVSRTLRDMYRAKFSRDCTITRVSPSAGGCIVAR
jgi:galactokinase